MGLFFTLLYILTAYLAPDTIFGAASQYHLQIVIALITMICTAFSLQGSGMLRLPQTYALVGLGLAVACSVIFNGWMGGGALALISFIPNAMTFFFVFLNCSRKWHLQAVVAVLLFAALYNVSQGLIALRTSDLTSPYLLTQHLSTDVSIARIRGISFTNDPNDLAQLLASLIPATFLFWAAGNPFRNFFLVVLPVAGLLAGMFFTHSRSGMLALLLMIIIAARRKIGVLPAIIGGAVLFVGLTAVGWTGGRSVAEGDDRIGAWSAGIGMIRAHPIFGVGYERFGDLYEITAHNSIVVCAAELGLVGLLFWILFTYPTLRDVFVASNERTLEPAKEAKEAKESAGLVSGAGLFARSANPPPHQFAVSTQGVATASASLLSGSLSPSNGPVPLVRSPLTFSSVAPEVQRAAEDREIHRICGLMMLSFAAFLTSGWFLSRAYTMTLFLFAGLAEAAYRMARDRQIAPPPLPLLRSLKWSALISVALLVFIYIFIVADHLLGH